MLDHIGISATDIAASKQFYLQALAPLGVGIVMEGPYGIGFGEGVKPYFWLNPATGRPTPIHLAFRAKTRGQVEDFHRAALAAGGTDNGPPGLRPHYHPNYYGAFVIGPDGHNIEAVCHAPSAD